MSERPGGVAIVGAGLSGLALAERLTSDGLRVTVFEARSRVGGRVLSRTAGPNEVQYDLGPAWVWPHNQRVLALAHQLDARLFQQHAQGRLVFEDPSGHVRRDLDFATMGDAMRIDGGITTLVSGLAQRLPQGVVKLGFRVNGLRATSGGVTLSASSDAGDFEAQFDHVVLALPPRVIAEQISFDPPLPQTLREAMRQVPTWMAAHAKLVAVYDRPFWREAGFSGDAISHRGPLMEIHDASPAHVSNGPALFGFVAPAVLAARPPEAAVRAAALEQLGRLFGLAAANPTHILLQNWAVDPLTAVDADSIPPSGHPQYKPLDVPGAPWRHLVTFAGTEVAPVDGGFLEGALEAAALAAEAVTGAVR